MASLKNWKAWVAFLIMLVVVRVAEKKVPAIASLTNPAI